MLDVDWLANYLQTIGHKTTGGGEDSTEKTSAHLSLAGVRSGPVLLRARCACFPP